ncbi:hypothetical protein TRIUR3_34021 [Triticum urartu]|uniref:Uncharacterized protein n=1 Tax=Triticum urartu TaxID=4572 RepID=M8A5A2_TRIUA|nr:hypothetical protein TRIUR3_34021 [Triticum urartu]
MALHPSGPVVFMEPLYHGQERDPVNVKFFHDARTTTGLNGMSHFDKCTSTSDSPSTTTSGAFGYVKFDYRRKNETGKSEDHKYHDDRRIVPLPPRPSTPWTSSSLP